MASVKFNANNAARNVISDLERQVLSKDVTRQIAKFVVERIKFEARNATPLNDTRSFPPLEDSSINIRSRSKKKKHPAFRPDLSNLTETGQLIEAIVFEIRDSGLLDIFVDGTSRPGEDLSNAEIDEKLRQGVESRAGGKKKFVLFTAQGLESEPKVMQRINSIVTRAIRRYLISRNS